MRDVSHWESYYRAGALVSCPMGSTGYDQEVYESWRQFFALLPSHAMLVDVATGNGAVACIAREVAMSGDKRFEIHGVDLAPIDPMRDVKDAAAKLSGIHFHPNVSAEALPFADDSVDAVFSQYGVEYTNLGQSLREIARVLRPLGKVQLISHHCDSVVCVKARSTIALGGALLDEHRLAAKLREYFSAGRDASEAAKLHQELTASAAALRRMADAAAERQIVDLGLDWLGRAFELGRNEPPSTSVQTVDAIEQALRAWLLRMHELVDAAWSPEDILRVQELCAEAGFVDFSCATQMHAQNNLVGWRIRMSKAHAAQPTLSRNAANL